MEKERFGVAVEPGTVAALRDLAGGQRKIGEFLSGAVKFLAANAETIRAYEWHKLVITVSLFEEPLYRELVTMRVKLDADTRAVEAMKLELETRLKALEPTA